MAIVPILIVPLVLGVSAIIQPILKKYSDKNLQNQQSKMIVLHELLNNVESVRTIAGGGFLHNKGSPKEFAVRVVTLSHFGPLAAPGCSRRWFSSFSCLTPNHYENWSQKLDSSIFGPWPPKLSF